MPCFARLHTWWRDRPVGPLLWLTVALLMPTACRIPRTEPASSDGSHTATIEDGAADYRGVPTLAIADASGREVDGILRFIVSRNGAVEDPVTVAYSTEDGTAVADDDYHPASGTLTIPAESTAAQVDVALIDDALPEGPETFTLRISDPTAAPMSAATGTGTILANDGYNDGDDGDDEVWPLELASLQVTGAGTLYPPFAGDILHYALTCPRSATVQVSAQALHNSAKLTLLRADTSANVVAAGTLNERLAVNHNHDIAIKLRDTKGTSTYVVHCLPATFPKINTLTRRSNNSGGLLLVTPQWSTETNAETYMALLDDNAVPRFHRRLSHEGSNFRRLPDGRYSLSLSRYKYVELYDKHLRYIKTVHPRPPLNGADGHDFLVTEEGNYLFMDYVSASRDVCKITTCDAGEERIETVRDSWIQEMTPNGTKLFEWNSLGPPETLGLHARQVP